MSFIKNIYNHIVQKPRLIFTIILLLLCFSFYYGKKFQLDASADTLLIENDPDLNYLREINERYKSEDFFVITYSPKEKLNRENIKDFKRFVDEINNFKWVSKTVSVLNTPLFESSDKPLAEKIKNVK